MKEYKYLAKNIGLLTIGNFGTKLLGFFLVPLYTSILSTAEYGTYDLFNTTIALLIPFFTLNIMESVLRFTIDKEANKKGIMSIALILFIRGFAILLVLTGINYFMEIFQIWKDYTIVFLLLYVFCALVGIMTSFARGLERIADISMSGVLCSGVIIGLNILFLVFFKWGITGYFLANIIGAAAQTIFLFIRTSAWEYMDFRYSNNRLKKEMTDYSKPLILNSVAWWVNNASDRYIVTWICGIATNGIYSVGYKIPSILNIFQSIFNQAWVLSAVKDFDPEDKDGFFSKMYNTYNCLMVIICSGLIVTDLFIAKILYAKEFFSAWKYVPFLTIAIVFGAMSGYIGGIFAAVKNSKIFAESTVVGAVINIILDIVLVNQIGALGAAIATAVSYFIVWLIRLVHMKKYMTIKLFLLRDFITYSILVVQSLILLCVKDDGLMYAAQFFMLSIIVLLFKSEIEYVYSSIKKKNMR